MSAIIESYESPGRQNDRPGDYPQQSSPENSDIRRRLRHWEIENSGRPILDSHNQEFSRTVSFRSTLLQPEDNRTFGEDLDDDVSNDPAQTIFEGGELVDFGKQRTFLRRGDLVELRYSQHCFFILYHPVTL